MNNLTCISLMFGIHKNNFLFLKKIGIYLCYFQIASLHLNKLHRRNYCKHSNKVV